LAFVSHDLRNPLGAILMSAGLLKMKASKSKEVEFVTRHADRIINAGERMNRLIDDILDLAKLNAQALSLKKVTLCGKTLLSDALEGMGPYFKEKSIHFALEIRDEEFCIEG